MKATPLQWQWMKRLVVELQPSIECTVEMG